MDNTEAQGPNRLDFVLDIHSKYSQKNKLNM